MKLLSLFILIITLISIKDAESQWTVFNLPYNGLAYELGFYNANSGVSIGHTLMTFQERIYFTTDSGFNWFASAFPSSIRALVNLQYINSQIIYTCGAENNSVFAQKPSGFSQFTYPMRQRFYIKGISEFFSEYKTAFLKSTNGGMNWFKVGTFDTTTGYMNDIHFFDELTGYSLIDTNPSTNPKFYKTINGGNSWQSLGKIDDSIYLDNMHFFNLNTGFACGATYNYNLPVQRGRIYKTTNGGLNWQKTEKSNVQGLTDIAFFNSTTGLAIGSSFPADFKCFRTTNSGISWDSVAFFPEVTFYNIKVVNGSGTAFMVGNRADTIFGFGNIATAKTTDYGTSWTLKTLNQTDLATGIALIDSSNFFMSGGLVNVARIFKSTNGGNVFIQQTGNEIPSSFSLEQNFPNPFNPVTNIKFNIPVVDSRPDKKGYKETYISGNDNYTSLIRSGLSAQEVTTLKVYDITGKEIKTLVNEYLSPGTYQVRFDASSLSSGIYIYRLQAYGFIESKKMLLIK